MTPADRKAAARSLVCPRCHAEAGKPCKTPGHMTGGGMLSPGKAIMSIHQERLELVSDYPPGEHVHTWQETDVRCDDCGSHMGLRCTDPDCGEVIDLVYQADPREAAP